VKDWGDVAQPAPGGLDALRRVVAVFREEHGVAGALPETCARCGAAVDHFWEDGEPLCQHHFAARSAETAG
jgi:hypothetical protein